MLGAAQLELQLGSSAASAGPAAGGAAPGTAPLPSPVDAAPSCGGGSGLLLTAVAAASDAAAAAAARQLAWLGSGGAVSQPSGGGGSPALHPDDVVAAKRGFQDHLLALMHQQRQAAADVAEGPAGAAVQAPAGLSAGERALIAAAAAFELVLGRLRGSPAAGVKAALAIYDQVLAALAPAQQGGQQAERAARPADVQLELLSWQRCALAADAARRAVPGAPPAAARHALLRALHLFPGSTPLLHLLLAHEMAGHTLTQLRRELHGLLEKAPSPQVWTHHFPPWCSLAGHAQARRRPGAYAALRTAGVELSGWWKDGALSVCSAAGPQACALKPAATAPTTWRWPTTTPCQPRPLQVWLAMLAVEVGSRSPGGAVAATLERAVSHPSGRACPLLWRCYLRFEWHRGRRDAVRRWARQGRRTRREHGRQRTVCKAPPLCLHDRLPVVQIGRLF